MATTETYVITVKNGELVGFSEQVWIDGSLKISKRLSEPSAVTNYLQCLLQRAIGKLRK